MTRHSKCNIPKEELEAIVSSSFSFAQILRKLNMKPASGNYKTLQKYIILHQIDISHLKGQGWFKGKTHNYNRLVPIEQILVKNSTYLVGHHLKKRLLNDKLIEYKCFECEISTWKSKPLSLHLDHINGINNDNRLENLRLLCPNCHSQTPTYCGKNKKLFSK